MGNGPEGKLCMLGGSVKGRVDIAGAGRVKTRTCILELGVQEFVARGPSAPDLKIGPQPLWGNREVSVVMRRLIDWIETAGSPRLLKTAPE